MADQPPKKNAAFIFYTALIDASNRPDFKAAPAIASGDFQVSTDGGALANLATLPTVTPASGVRIKVSLSASEMNGDNIGVVGIDAAGAEWDDIDIAIQTATRQLSELAYPAISGRSMTTSSGGKVAADVRLWLGLAVSALSNAQVSASVAAGLITQFRGDTWSIALTGLGSIASSSDVWFSVKSVGADSEDDAIIRLSDTVGLERINKASATAGDGSLTVDDSGAGDVTMTLVAARTAELAPGRYLYDVQWANAGGAIFTIASGTLIVLSDVTKAVA